MTVAEILINQKSPNCLKYVVLFGRGGKLSKKPHFTDLPEY